MVITRAYSKYAPVTYQELLDAGLEEYQLETMIIQEGLTLEQIAERHQQDGFEFRII